MPTTAQEPKTGETGKRHHQAICGEDQKGKSPEITTNKNNHETETKQDVVPTTINVARTKTNVVLQTARAFVRGRDESKVVEARILFDGGSQRLYVTQELQEKLGVKRNGTEILHVNTKQKCDIVELCVSKNGDETMIKVLTFPTSCSKFSTMTEVRNYPHLQGLELRGGFRVRQTRQAT